MKISIDALKKFKDHKKKVLEKIQSLKNLLKKFLTSIFFYNNIKNFQSSIYILILHQKL